MVVTPAIALVRPPGMPPMMPYDPGLNTSTTYIPGLPVSYVPPADSSRSASPVVACASSSRSASRAISLSSLPMHRLSYSPSLLVCDPSSSSASPSPARTIYASSSSGSLPSVTHAWSLALLCSMRPFPVYIRNVVKRVYECEFCGSVKAGTVFVTPTNKRVCIRAHHAMVREP